MLNYKVIKNIQEDETLKNNVLNGKNDSPMIYVNKMKILDTGEEKLNNSGFTFYREENETS